MHEKYGYLLNKDKVLVVEGGLAYDDYFGGYRLTAKNIMDINLAREQFAKRLEVDIDAGATANGMAKKLESVLQPYAEGACRVWLKYQGPQSYATLSLGESWRVKPSDELLHRLQSVVGENGVRMVY